jgi:hypothetical protein
MMEETSSYTIEIETPREYIQSLIDFIDQKYIKPQRERFADVSRKILGGFPSIAFTLLDSTGKQSLSLEVIGSKPLKLNIKRLQPTASMEEVEEAKQDVIIVVEFFEEKVRSSTLFLAWREGEDIVPEKLHAKEKSLNLLQNLVRLVQRDFSSDPQFKNCKISLANHAHSEEMVT